MFGVGIRGHGLGLGVPVVPNIIPMVIVGTYGTILAVSVVWFLFVFCLYLCYVFVFWFALRFYLLIMQRLMRFKHCEKDNHKTPLYPHLLIHLLYCFVSNDVWLLSVQWLQDWDIQLQVGLMSYAKENVQAASCAGEVTTGGGSVNISAPLSRIEQLEMYKAKKRETVKCASTTKERNLLTVTDTSTANVKPYGWLKASTPHHYTPSPVLARVRKRLEGARPPVARAGARDVASAFKVSMAKTAAENAGNVVTKAPPTADSQQISTKVPQVLYLVCEFDISMVFVRISLSSLYCQCFDLPLTTFHSYILTPAVLRC